MLRISKSYAGLSGADTSRRGLRQGQQYRSSVKEPWPTLSLVSSARTWSGATFTSARIFAAPWPDVCIGLACGGAFLQLLLRVLGSD